jgi:formylglycine-generating enzyme
VPPDSKPPPASESAATSATTEKSGRGKQLGLVLLIAGGLGLVLHGATSGSGKGAPSATASARFDKPPAPATEPLTPASTAPPACAPEMVLVAGEYCTDVRQDCNHWLDDAALPFARCGDYNTTSRCVGKRVPMRFCIDRREYTPPGEKLPQNWASYDIAKKTCEGIGKRLCTDNEWNFACEGEDMLPYPYGYSRAPVCNQDQKDLFEKNPRMQVLKDLREPADGRPECKSPFGVENMVGNMDEPVAREGFENNAPFRNALKGGWWMPARNRCRPATTAHDDFFKDIQIGVRCCGAATEVPSSSGPVESKSTETPR